MKLCYEDKKKIIKLRSNGLTIKAIANEMNLNIDTVRWIIKLHSVHGDEALIKQKNKSYTASFKNNIIKEYLLGIPKKALAVKYNVSKSLIISWIKDYELFGYNEIKTKKRGRPKLKQEDLSKPLTDKERKELIETKKELRKVQLELAYLKKLDALVQERIKKEKKK